MSDAQFSIRKAGTSDARSVAAVCVTSWRAAHEDLLPRQMLDMVDEARDAAGFVKWLGRPDIDGFVAEDSERVVGFAMLRPPLNDIEMTGFGEISTLYVAPDSWRQGIGRALCQAALDRARERSMTGVIAWVLNGNDRATQFFESEGFHADGKTETDNGAPEQGRLSKSRLRHEFISGKAHA